MVGAGQNGTRDITVSPGDAAISVSSSNTGIATVSLSGRRLTINGGNTAGTATITVTASKSGYNSCTRTFHVTVDPIREFIVEGGIAIGCKTVIVKLWYSDPQNYNVSVGGVPLKYLSSKKMCIRDRVYTCPNCRSKEGIRRVNPKNRFALFSE